MLRINGEEVSLTAARPSPYQTVYPALSIISVDGGWTKFDRADRVYIEIGDWSSSASISPYSGHVQGRSVVTLAKCDSLRRLTLYPPFVLGDPAKFFSEHPSIEFFDGELDGHSTEVIHIPLLELDGNSVMRLAENGVYDIVSKGVEIIKPASTALTHKPAN